MKVITFWLQIWSTLIKLHTLTFFLQPHSWANVMNQFLHETQKQILIADVSLSFCKSSENKSQEWNPPEADLKLVLLIIPLMVEAPLNESPFTLMRDSPLECNSKKLVWGMYEYAAERLSQICSCANLKLGWLGCMTKGFKWLLQAISSVPF